LLSILDSIKVKVDDGYGSAKTLPDFIDIGLNVINRQHN
jgi:hypothetical protein